VPPHLLRSRLWLPRPRAEVFAFFAEPENLAVITPPWLGFAVLSAPAPLRAGAVIDYRFRWLGLPLRWRSLISEYAPPERFVDVQVRGPYARWEHEHLFREGIGAGSGETPAGTWVEDRVTYLLPLGPLGRLAQGLLVRRQMEAIFAYRRRRLAERFGARGDPGGSAIP